MRNAQKFVVAGLFTALLAALATVMWQLVDRFGWYTASVYGVIAVWVVGMCGLVLGDAINFYLERKRRSPRP